MTVTQVSTTIKPGADSLTIEAISHLYNYKAVAALRENIGNALDAMTEAGKADTPVDVHLYPGNETLRVVVSDTGIGMTKDEVANNYLSVEVSRKRERDDLIGGHGIGVLATFTCTDTLTVVTTKNGKTTLVTGNDRGSGDITWTLVDSPQSRSDGTSVDFTMSVRGDDTTAVSQYLILLAYMRRIRLHAHVNSDVDDDIIIPLVPKFLHMRAQGSGMVSENEDKSVITVYPFALLDDSSLAVSGHDIDFLMGHHTGMVAVPTIVGDKSRVPVGRFMVMVGGLPYRVGVNSVTGLPDSYITVLTEEFTSENIPDFRVTSIPRNREYVEGGDSGFASFLSGPERAVSLAKEALYDDMDSIQSEFRYTLDNLSDDISQALIRINPSHMSQPFLTVAIHALALSMDASGPLSSKNSVCSIPRDQLPPYIAALNKIFIESNSPDDMAYSENIASYLKKTMVPIGMGNPHAASQALMANGYSEKERITLGHGIETMRAITANFASKKHASIYTAIDNASDSVVTCKVSDDVPSPGIFTKEDRKAVSAEFGRSSSNIFVIPSTLSNADIARGHVFESLHNSLATRRFSSQFVGSGHPRADSMSAIATRFTDTILGGGGECIETTWKELSSAAAATSKKNDPEWMFTRYWINKDGTLAEEQVRLSTKQFRKAMKDGDAFSMPYSTKFMEQASRQVTVFRPTHPRLKHNNGEIKRIEEIGYAALYRAGYRAIYVYRDKTGTVADKESRTSWLDPWRIHAAPAMTKAARDRYDELARRNILTNFLDTLPGVIPSKNVVSGMVAKAALDAGYPIDAVFRRGDVPVEKEVMDRVYEQVKNRIPRAFVLPIAVTINSDGMTEEKTMRTLAARYLKSSTPSIDVFSEHGSTVMNAVRKMNVSSEDIALLNATPVATVLSFDIEETERISTILSNLQCCLERDEKASRLHSGEDVERDVYSGMFVPFSDEESDGRPDKYREFTHYRYGPKFSLTDCPEREKLVEAITPYVAAVVENSWHMLNRVLALRSTGGETTITEDDIKKVLEELTVLSETA